MLCQVSLQGLEQIWISRLGYVADTRIGDVVCVLLGCMSPILLRRNLSQNVFQVVGECYIYGIMDGESLLGPIPSPWKVRPARERGSDIFEPRYWNTAINAITREDPRLGDLPPEWERIKQRRTTDDPILFAPHRNKLTGEIINSDPRMLPENLRARGVDLQSFQLV